MYAQLCVCLNLLNLTPEANKIELKNRIVKKEKFAIRMIIYDLFENVPTLKHSMLNDSF